MSEFDADAETRRRQAQHHQTQRDALLEATLSHVAFDGWSLMAMRAGARDIDLPETDFAELFPDGAAQLAAHFNDWADRKMLAVLEATDLAALKIRERIAAGVRARLTVLEPHREAVRRAMGLVAGPFGSAAAARAIYRTVDLIWYAAGDTATDFNFYTKRALLAGVYGPTVLYWLNDRSEGLSDTWEFLDRRLANVMQIPKMTAGLRRAAERLTAPLQVLRGFRR
jgi:ubiquinone biosynthesis protein COQ9